MSNIVKQDVIYNPKREEVVIRPKRNEGLRTPFSAIGPLTNVNQKRGHMEPDVFDRLDKVSKGAFSVFKDLKSHRSVETNLTIYPGKDNMTRTQKETLSRRLKELKEQDLVRPVTKTLFELDQQRTFNVRRGTLIINPELIRCINHDEAECYWNQCGE